MQSKENTFEEFICRLHVTIVDSMSQIKKMLFSKFHAFSEVFNAAWNSVEFSITSQFQQLQIIFDRYLQHSVKEQHRRATGKFLEILNIKQELHVPAQMERFWECSTKKNDFTIFISRVSYPKVTRDCYDIVLSGFYSNNETALCVEVELWS